MTEHVSNEKQFVALCLCVCCHFVRQPCLLHTCLQQVFCFSKFFKTFEKSFLKPLMVSGWAEWEFHVRVPFWNQVTSGAHVLVLWDDLGPKPRVLQPLQHTFCCLLVFAPIPALSRLIVGCSSLVLASVVALLSGHCCSSAWSTLTAWSSLHWQSFFSCYWHWSWNFSDAWYIDLYHR